MPEAFILNAWDGRELRRFAGAASAPVDRRPRSAGAALPLFPVLRDIHSADRVDEIARAAAVLGEAMKP